MNLLEPHHFGAVDFPIRTFIIALYCAIIHGLSNLFRFLFVVMTSLTRLAVTKTEIAIELAGFRHVVGIHTVSVPLLLSTPYLFVGTLYKTLDKYYQACYNLNQRDMFDQFISP